MESIEVRNCKVIVRHRLMHNSFSFDMSSLHFFDAMRLQKSWRSVALPLSTSSYTFVMSLFIKIL